jgi:fructose-1-phosphate kinase PfkB-like protein
MLFDHVELDEVNRAIEVRRNAAGKPVNVARVLHTLGDRAMLCVPLGGDTGHFIRHELQQVGIPQDCPEIASPTRTCVTVVDRKAKTATELVEEHGPMTPVEVRLMLQKLEARLAAFPSPSTLGEGKGEGLPVGSALADATNVETPPSEEGLRPLKRTLRQRPSPPPSPGVPQEEERGGVKMLVLSGALAAGIDPGFYAECCKLARQANIPVILDAREEPLLRAMAYEPLLVKPNRSELAKTLGATINDDESLRASMVKLRKMGAQWVLTTLGPRGSLLTDGQSFWKIPALNIEYVSAIGSGDAFTAGLAAAISRGADAPDACRLATACAAANAMVLGAGLLRLDDVHRLEPQVHLQKL